MAEARAPISRVVLLITLLAVATVALLGYIPGAPESTARRTIPSALSVAMMPVLLLVSVVILLAGVLASQHRLPLAMPEAEEKRPWWRLGRAGLLALAAFAALTLLFAALSAVLFIGFGRQGEPPPPPPPASGRPAAPTAGGPPDAAQPPDALTGTALLLAIVVAVLLIAVAVIGLVVVAISSRRHPQPAPLPLTPATTTVVDSLARAAEMGLAALDAPGQDPRTAIIACYVAMEHGLAFDRAAAPLVSDTPMEVLARAFERGALHDASARELVALFEEARFSPHSMLEWQRMRAEQLLRIVLADLQGEVVS
ncbi:DUF4129 domain-containing protein [Nocardia sp. NPDC052566]|uniref:DUF4129 domain-containing protein n=1 Tax=Nocardia sp. NPDC052566 TaxID=3364330 RepID=UPI0037CA5AE9